MPEIRRVFDARGTSDVLYGSPQEDRFVLSRDGNRDEIRWFRDGEDKINLWSWDIKFDSLMVVRVSLLEYRVYVRDEVTVVKFVQPAPADIPADGVLLDESDFIFRSNLPDAPVQVQVEQVTDGREVLVGTTLPDEFVFSYDGRFDIINKFELGKDRIDLSGYGTSFDDLTIETKRDGRVSIRVDTAEGPDYLQVNDPSFRFRAEDFEASDFIF
ncbi:MAG: hypothetical protein AAFY59_09905 [Pseudomonadota bacterium]